MADSKQDLQNAIDAIEEMYEFTLAYAAQGISTHEATKTGAELRGHFDRAQVALNTLGDLFADVISSAGLEPRESYQGFLDVLRDDARKANAAVQLTSAQPAISSQLVDNLNASIHVRALLTDIFLLDEMIASREVTATA